MLSSKFYKILIGIVYRGSPLDNFVEDKIVDTEQTNDL